MQSLAKLKPLFLGRLSRVIVGAAILVVVPFVEYQGAEIIGVVVLIILGLSFLVGGLVANPGCEVTALLNLVLPAKKRVHVI
jgi:hypothetical protein